MIIKHLSSDCKNDCQHGIKEIMNKPLIELEPFWIMPDNSLFDLGYYISWHMGAPKAILDGEFTAEQLHAVANHMEQHHKLYLERTKCP